MESHKPTPPTLAWAQPLQNDNHDGAINNLNQALESYAKAYMEDKPTKNYLVEIIEACENYIQQIPKRTREKTPYDQLIKILPQLAVVLDIQKNAVGHLYLPAATNSENKNNPATSRDTLARFELLRQLILDDKITDPKQKEKLPSGRILDELFWSEFKFKGKIFVSDWVNNKSVYKNRFLSFNEVIKELQQNLGNVGSEPDYENKNIYFKSVKITKGKLTIDNKPLSSSGARSTIHNLYDEVLFAIDRNNNFYVSDPRKEIGTDAHHSVPLQGKRALCAGTLKVENGKIISITIDSGHYKPRSKELVAFLKFLQAQGVDLSTVTIIDRSGFTKNALRYLNYKGVSLPENKGEMFYKLAKEIEEDPKEESLWRDYIEKAAKLDHPMAKFEQAKARALGEHGYPVDMQAITDLKTLYPTTTSTIKQRIRIVLLGINPDLLNDLMPAKPTLAPLEQKKFVNEYTASSFEFTPKPFEPTRSQKEKEEEEEEGEVNKWEEVNKDPWLGFTLKSFDKPTQSQKEKEEEEGEVNKVPWLGFTPKSFDEPLKSENKKKNKSSPEFSLKIFDNSKQTKDETEKKTEEPGTKFTIKKSSTS